MLGQFDTSGAEGTAGSTDNLQKSDSVTLVAKLFYYFSTGSIFIAVEAVKLSSVCVIVFNNVLLLTFYRLNLLLMK